MNVQPPRVLQSRWRLQRRRWLPQRLAVAPPRMSYEEFLAWADEDTYAEWVDGEVAMSSPASLKHQEILKFLGQIISLHLEHSPVGVVILAPFQL